VGKINSDQRTNFFIELIKMIDNKNETEILYPLIESVESINQQLKSQNIDDEEDK
jgi:hypothetical protein